jgi:hypothetical protein
MKFQSALIAAFALCLTTAVAAPPPTPLPGTPSGLVPVQHPAYKAICPAGFAPTPAGYTYDLQDPNAAFQCIAPYQCSSGYNLNTSWGSGVTGTPPKYYFVCVVSPNASGRQPVLSCGVGSTFTPVADSVNRYTCTSGPLTCPPALSVDHGPSGAAIGTAFLWYKCDKSS